MEIINELEKILNNSEIEKISPVLRHSIFLKNRIAANPYLVKSAFEKLDTIRDKKTILNELQKTDILNLNEENFLKQLRIFKVIEYILIAIEELYYYKNIEEITVHLSSFATAILEIAYLYGYEHLKKRYGTPIDDNGKEVGFAVIGLGKLGGWELNFSSDIDLIYVYDTEKGKTTGIDGKNSISNHEFFIKLGEKIKYYINERTDDGFVYRVDLRLRPDGDKGPLALPVRSYETYYEMYGQNWERMMLLKGSVVAGKKEIGEKLLKNVRPFIFRRSIDYKLINDLLDVKSKIAGRIKLKGNKKDVKLGFGGIREIEFTVQALQILNYPKYPEIYSKNTIESIKLLKKYSILSPEDADTLEQAYRFLRKLEHMAQIENEQQTYVIPETSERFSLYVERCGFNDITQFYKRYEDITSQVNKIFNSIISEEKPSIIKIISDSEIELDDLIEFFSSEGFKSPDTVAELARKIVTRRGEKTRSQNETNLLLNLMEIILNEIKPLDDPAKVLYFFEKFFSRPDAVYLFYDIFSSSPIILKKLISIIEYSNYLPNLILQNRNLLDYIYDPKDTNYKSYEILEIFKSDVKKTDDEEFEYNLTRKKFQELFFNLAYAYLNGEINVIKCNKSLTKLAKGVVCFAFQREYERLVTKMGHPLKNNGETCNYLILGMGKLGSDEISFGSDLDLIVLYEDSGYTSKGDKTNQEFFSRLVQKVIAYLATPTIYGYLYTIDMRLRPSGAKGALVTTFKSFSDYQYKKAMLWEKQALLRAGVINEDSKMKSDFINLVNDVLFNNTIEEKDIKEIYDMRMRIQSEKGEPYEAYDIKAGYGGIIDVEFLVQMFQLKYGKDLMELREKNTHDLLHNLAINNLIKNRDFYSLHNNYIFFRNLENIIRIYENKGISKLPKSPVAINKIAKFLNFKNSEKLFNQIDDGRKIVRSVFNKLFQQESLN